MLTFAKMLGAVRRSPLGAVPDYSDGEPGQMPAINNRGELLVAQGLPQRTELTRLGRSWSVTIPTGSAFTPVAAWPATLCNLEIFNNEPAGGMSYLIETCWVAAITSLAAASSITLLGQLIVNPAAPTNNTAVLIVSRSGKANYSGRMTRALATTVATASQWDVLGAAAASPAASIGAGVFADVWGQYIVPPQSAFAVNAVFSTAAGTAIQGITFSEVYLPNVV